MSYHYQYKKKSLQFTRDINPTQRRILDKVAESKNARSEKFSERRLQGSEGAPAAGGGNLPLQRQLRSGTKILLTKDETQKKAPTNNRKQLLAQWKEERDKRKTLEKGKSKPIFHNCVSDVSTKQVLTTLPKEPQPKPYPSSVRRVTRSMTTNKNSVTVTVKETREKLKTPTKLSFAPEDFQFKPVIGVKEYSWQKDGVKSIKSKRHISILPPITEDSSPLLVMPPKLDKTIELTNTHSSSTVLAEEENVVVTNNVIVPIDFQTPEGKQDEEHNMNKQFILSNPNITIGRGLSERRKKGQFRKDRVSGGDTDILFKPMIDEHLNMASGCSTLLTKNEPITPKALDVEEKKESKVEEKESISKGDSRVTQLRTKLQAEIDILNSHSSEWQKILGPNIPDEISGLIIFAIGQSTQLITDKFKQFESLMHDCERGDEKVLYSDLQGYWDVMDFSINDVKKKFATLATLQANGWVDKAAVVKPEKTMKKTVKFKPKPAVKPRVASGLGAHIIAARKKAMSEKTEREAQVAQEMETLVEKINDVAIIYSSPCIRQSTNFAPSLLDVENTPPPLALKTYSKRNPCNVVSAFDALCYPSKTITPHISEDSFDRYLKPSAVNSSFEDSAGSLESLERSGKPKDMHRRSTRLSVKFSDTTCTPVSTRKVIKTPYSRKNRGSERERLTTELTSIKDTDDLITL